MRKMISTMVATAALACSLSANAIPVTFDISKAKSSVSVTDLDTSGCFSCGISVGLASGLGNEVATLSAGDSWDFDFFSIGFSGLGLISGSISATLGFDAPTGAPSAGGDAEGAAFTLFGVVTGGYLSWTTPTSTFALGNGAIYDVWFDDLVGITGGSAKVSANIRLRREASVPEPAVLSLLGLGLLGVALRSRRKQA